MVWLIAHPTLAALAFGAFLLVFGLFVAWVAFDEGKWRGIEMRDDEAFQEGWDTRGEVEHALNKYSKVGK
jgi:hypothetical protein